MVLEGVVRACVMAIVVGTMGLIAGAIYHSFAT